MLLGSVCYNESVDMWACGCIMAELLRAEPLFPASLSTSQLLCRWMLFRKRWAAAKALTERLRMQAKTELETMQLIMRLLGAPTANVWPVIIVLAPRRRASAVRTPQHIDWCPQGFQHMPIAQQVALPHQPYNYLKKASRLHTAYLLPVCTWKTCSAAPQHAFALQEFAMLSEAGVDLMNSFLTFDPERRISAKQALCHPWFQEHPQPQKPDRKSCSTASHNIRAHRTRQRCASTRSSGYLPPRHAVRCGCRETRARLSSATLAGKMRMTAAILSSSALLYLPMLASTSCSAPRVLQSGGYYEAAKDSLTMRTSLVCFAHRLAPVRAAAAWSSTDSSRQ